MCDGTPLDLLTDPDIIVRTTAEGREATTTKVRDVLLSTAVPPVLGPHDLWILATQGRFNREGEGKKPWIASDSGVTTIPIGGQSLSGTLCSRWSAR